MIQIPTPEPDWHGGAQPLSRPRAPPPGFHAPPQQAAAPPYSNYMAEHQALGRLLGGSMDSLFSRQHSQLAARSGVPGRFGGGHQPADLLFNHFGKQASVHDHSMLLFEHNKQAGQNPLGDGFGNKDWQVR